MKILLILMSIKYCFLHLHEAFPFLPSFRHFELANYQCWLKVCLLLKITFGEALLSVLSWLEKISNFFDCYFLIIHPNQILQGFFLFFWEICRKTRQSFLPWHHFKSYSFIRSLQKFCDILMPEFIANNVLFIYFLFIYLHVHTLYAVMWLSNYKLWFWSKALFSNK
jgi:hypothetical protein